MIANGNWSGIECIYIAVEFENICFAFTLNFTNYVISKLFKDMISNTFSKKYIVID